MGGGFCKAKNLKKCMKFNWNFQRGGGGLRKNPFHGGGMDIFWNYKMQIKLSINFKLRKINNIVLKMFYSKWKHLRLLNMILNQKKNLYLN